MCCLRFAATPGLKLEVSLGCGRMTSARGRSSWRSGTWCSPPALLNLPTGSTSGRTARPQGQGGVARAGPGCRRERMEGLGPDRKRVSWNRTRSFARQWFLVVRDMVRPPCPVPNSPCNEPETGLMRGCACTVQVTDDALSGAPSTAQSRRRSPYSSRSSGCGSCTVQVLVDTTGRGRCAPACTVQGGAEDGRHHAVEPEGGRG